MSNYSRAGKTKGFVDFVCSFFFKHDGKNVLWLISFLVLRHVAKARCFSNNKSVIFMEAAIDTGFFFTIVTL